MKEILIKIRVFIKKIKILNIKSSVRRHLYEVEVSQ